MINDSPLHINPNLIEKYNVPVPRYTSYPPANHFNEDFSETDYLTLVDESNTKGDKNISIYIHIPFCNKICHYCGCNACAIGTGNRVKSYLDALKKEIVLITDRLVDNRKVSQIHYGGGTPNALPALELKELNELIYSNFELIEKPEIAIECNPAYIDKAYLDVLLEAGFNRFSFGIQDFNPEVLKTVNRDTSNLPVESLVKQIKQYNTNNGINLDFIYGLPLQTRESFLKTIEKAIAINPDRLVTFSYAHVPWMKKQQSILEKHGLPDAYSKMDMFVSAYNLLTSNGFSSLGLDHFVKSNDELSEALNNGQLHRNFQGYCTQRTTGQVYAFGVSAISQLHGGYSQNTKDMDQYIQLLTQDTLPVEKGIQITEDQRITREVINQLMCNRYINWNELGKRLSVASCFIQSIVDFNASNFKVFIDDGLLHMTKNSLSVTREGNLFVRNVASMLDKAYRQKLNTYSKSV